MKLPEVELLYVSFHGAEGLVPVGRLAAKERRIYFEYDASFLARGIELSPFHLPLRSGVHEEKKYLFDGLFGLFHDSLPDGWGRLLLDREMERNGVNRALLTPLHRLACVGGRGMGALSYRPAIERKETKSAELDLDRLARSAARILSGATDEVFGELLALGGSSGGARPKALVGWRASDDHLMHGADELPADYAPYLIKFRSSDDPPDAGRIEWAYREMAAAAGLEVAEARLFFGARRAAYFGARRFDRAFGGARRHLHSLSGLLHASHRMPGSLSYEDFLRATHQLTRDHRELLRAFRWMAFNVLAHNRDDHVKNFAFLLDDDGQYRLTPAYDLTFSDGPGGEHWMSIAGEGRAPTDAHLLELAKRVAIQERAARAIIDEVRVAVLAWRKYAKAADVSRTWTEKIAGVLGAAARPSRGRAR